MAVRTEDGSAGGGGGWGGILLDDEVMGLAGVPRLIVGKVDGGNGVVIVYDAFCSSTKLVSWLR